MKLIVVIFFALAVTNNSAFASEDNLISISRSIVIETCDTSSKCIQQIYPDEKQRLVKIELLPFHKAGTSGIHGEEKLQIFKDNIPFTCEIYINKSKSHYSLYAVLRSGIGSKRHGVTNKIVIDDISAFKPIAAIDQPMSINNKTYRAKLIVGPE